MIVRILNICLISSLDEKSFCFWFVIYMFCRFEVKLMFLWIFNLIWLGNIEGMICSCSVVSENFNLGVCGIFLFVEMFFK